MQRDTLGHDNATSSSPFTGRSDDVLHQVLTHVRAYDRQGLPLTFCQLCLDLRLADRTARLALARLRSLGYVRHSRGRVRLDAGVRSEFI